jgi:thymidylate synthase (FAD)
MEIKVLDHGYARLIETWGSDERVIEAARMSTNKGFLGWGPHHAEEDHTSGCSSRCKSGDEKLLRYLWEHKHATPFEMAGLIVEVQAPIMVFREWHRHRTQSYNELSARYTQMPDLHYVPAFNRVKAQDAKNRQATGTAELPPKVVSEFLREIEAEQRRIYENYDRWLKLGVPKELARLNTPVSRYSRMRASANLRNWLAFLTLRMAPDAQWEIRQYANAVGEMIKASFPHTWELFAA